MRGKTVKLVLNIVRYLLPAVIGWIEGDSKAISDAVLAILSLF